MSNLAHDVPCPADGDSNSPVHVACSPREMNEVTHADESRNLQVKHVLQQLRRRIERQLGQEVRLSQLYQGWQECWSYESEAMQRHIARLEAHLAAWWDRPDPAPVFSVVRADSGRD